MRRFEQVPHALASDRRLTVGARALYPILRRLAWEAGRREPDDAVPLPTVREIADELGAAESTCRSYVAELRATGWVETRRAGRNRPSLWVVRDDPRAPNIGAQDPVPSAEYRRTRAPNIGGRTTPSTDDQQTGTTSPSDEPPPNVLVDGRNLPLDALCRRCGIDPSSPRVGQAVAALNGTTRPRKPGIRHLFWEEARRYADEHHEESRLQELRSEPERYAEALARAVERKADAYQRRMPGAEMTPTALRDWWLDLARPLPGAPRGGLTPDEIERSAA